MLLKLEKPMLPVTLAELPQELEHPAVKRPLVFLAPEVQSELKCAPEQQNVDGGKLTTVEKDPNFLGIKASRWTTAALGMAAD